MGLVCGRLKFTIEQGSTFRPNVQILQAPDENFDPDDPTTFPAPVDITGFDARIQIRTAIEAPTVIIELTVGNGGIEFLDATNGKLRFVISDAVTAAFDLDDFDGPAVGDLEMIDTVSEVFKPFGVAHFVLKEEVTR